MGSDYPDVDDGSAHGIWITSADGVTVAEAAADTSKTATVSEISDDKGGNTTPKLYLANKAVQCVLNDAVSTGMFKLSYDVMIDKTTNSSNYGRYFRT